MGTILNPGVGGDTIATELIGTEKHELVKIEFGVPGTATMVSAGDPLPVTDAVAEASLTSLAAEDFATQATLAAVLAKLSADPSTETTLASILSKLNASIAVTGSVTVTGGGDASAANQVTGNNSLASILAKIISAPSTEAKQDALISANHTDLAAILAKLIASPATSALQTTGNTSLASIDTKLTNPLPVSAASLPLPSGASTEATLASILAKIIAAPATSALQTSGNTSLASIDTKLTNPLPISGVTSNTNLDVALSTRLKAADTLTGVTTVGTVTTITNTVPTQEVAPTAIFNGKTTVTTAGTRTTLAASQTVKSVTIKALSTNTGIIYVGNSTVAAANGFQLSAGDTISLDISNLNTVNIDASVSLDACSYIGVN